MSLINILKDILLIKLLVKLNNFYIVGGGKNKYLKT